MPVDHREPAAPPTRTGWLLDLVAGVAVAAVWLGVAAFWRGRGWSPDQQSWTVAGLWLGLAVGLRRQGPTWLLAVLTVAYPLVYLQPLTSDLHLAPIVVLGFTVAQRQRTVLALATSTMAVLLLFSPVVIAGSLWPLDWIEVVRATGPAGPVDLGPGVRGPWPADWSGFAVAEVATIAIVLLGATLASQREGARALAARNAELEQLRHAEAARAVTEERLRISRELHDVVAHHLTAVLMRAQAADHVAGRRPEEAVAAVEWIAEASREALTAIRRTVGELRSATDGQPGPTLAEELDDMAARLGDVGLRVHVDRAGADGVTLTASSDLAVRRVVLESLTNVLRHASARHATVLLRAHDGGLSVSVTDDGRAAGSARPREGAGGTGLRGLRERLASCGGRLDYGPVDTGGWSVVAWVPSAPGPASTPAPPTRLQSSPA
jgi:signal transduction histidine kinase